MVTQTRGKVLIGAGLAILILVGATATYLVVKSKQAVKAPPMSAADIAEGKLVLDKARELYSTNKALESYDTLAKDSLITNTLKIVLNSNQQEYNQVLCAQNVPQGVSYSTPVIYHGPESATDTDRAKWPAKDATLTVTEEFGPPPSKIDIRVVMVKENGAWKTSGITCPTP